MLISKKNNIFQLEPSERRLVGAGALVLLIWNLAIILAPAFMGSEKTVLQYLGSTVYFYMDPVCHQLAERSLVLFGLPTPVCTRCIFIYQAGFIVFGWIFVRNRIRLWPWQLYGGITIFVLFEKFIIVDLYVSLRVVAGFVLGILLFRLILEGIFYGYRGKLNG